jgi:hypothetical protein
VNSQNAQVTPLVTINHLGTAFQRKAFSIGEISSGTIGNN